MNSVRTQPRHDDYRADDVGQPRRINLTGPDAAYYLKRMTDSERRSMRTLDELAELQRERSAGESYEKVRVQQMRERKALAEYKRATRKIETKPCPRVRKKSLRETQ